MVTLADITPLVCGPVPTQETTMRRLVDTLTRSLANDGISDDLYDALNEVLCEQTGPAPTAPGRAVDNLVICLRLPLPRRSRQHSAHVLSVEEAARINDRFRRATTQLMQVAPHRVATYPAEELRLLLALRDERPEPGQAVPHLRRFALAILALLDLMGDDK
ncbi:hypothetical protein GCM10009654_06100 [Streptomyces hebeiensis]|uniref:Uncharacterized protein n=1 Tax=Streptomyces hebeiensis TaxID=229486 RepID=A0ABN1UIG5_9ACTN